MPSPIDDLYEALFGTRPTKDGEAYEKIAAAVCKLLSQGSPVFHDQRMRGLLSNSLYQIDVLKNEDENDPSFGEAKDYTDAERKVGRPDLQKLGGALPDLKVSSGLFFSATDYTKPARQYASAAKDIVGKPISLMHLRPSTEEDENGRIKRIVLQLTVRTPNYDKSQFGCVFTEEAKVRVLELKNSGDERFAGKGISIDRIYNSDGELACTIAELTAKGFPEPVSEASEACYVLPGLSIKIGDEFFPIKGIQYRVLFDELVQEIQINANGKAVFLVRDDNGSIDTLVTDADLKRVSFDESGEARIKE